MPGSTLQKSLKTASILFVINSLIALFANPEQKLDAAVFTTIVFFYMFQDKARQTQAALRFFNPSVEREECLPQLIIDGGAAFFDQLSSVCMR